MRTLFHRFINDQSGVTAIEYGLIASLIAVAIIGAVHAWQHSTPCSARSPPT
jgi:pilus assembly protein Flp/PilA